MADDDGISDAYDLFVSYTDADRAWVEGYLFDALAAARVRFTSVAAFELGAPKLSELERAVRSSRRVLIVASPNYLTDNYAHFGELLAQTYGAETETWPVIPLVLSECELPIRLRMLTALDATEPTNWNTAIERLCAALDNPLPQERSRPPCPYPGMLPFGEDDRGRFFGRDAETRDAVERLRLHRFLAVIGPSGSGKSSLVAAGMVPALRGSGLFGSGEWTIVSVRPGPRPVDALEAALEGSLDDPIAAVDRKVAARPDAERLLVVCDQFEEVFTVGRDQATEFQERVDRLSRVDRCWVILAARADFYADLMASPLWPDIRSHRMEIVPLGDDGLRAAITRPAQEVDVHVDPALVERLVADAADEPGVLPLVQETLVLLWDRLERRYLPVDAYESLAVGDDGTASASGLHAAMARRADHALAELDDDEAAMARRIFLRSVQFGEGRADTRRQQAISDLRSVTDRPERFDGTLHALVGHRLLTSTAGDDGTDARIDLAHEALITGWPTLACWLDERRDAEQTRRQLESKAAEWVRLGRGRGGLLDEVELAEAERWLASPDADELGYDADLPQLVRASGDVLARDRARARRRARVTVGALAIGLLVVAGLAVWGAISARTARQEADRARLAEAIAEDEADRARLAEATAEDEADRARLAEATAEERRQESEDLARTALSRQLAAQAVDEMDDHLERALLLAVQAYRTDPTLEARSSLLSTLQHSPHLIRFLPSDQPASTLTVDWPIVELATSPDGDRIVRVGGDGLLRITDAESGIDVREATRIAPESTFLPTVALSDDRRLLAVEGCPDPDSTDCETKTIRVWDVEAESVVASIDWETSFVLGLEFSADSRRLAMSGGFDPAEVYVWDFEMEEPVSGPMPTETYSLAFSPDGRTLATGIPVVSTATGEAGVVLWDVASGSVLASTDVYVAGGTNAIAFSPDGSLIAAGHGSGRVKLLGAAALEEVAEPFDGPDGVLDLAFSPDGSFLAAGYHGDEHVLLWDVLEPARPPRRLAGHRDGATSLAFDADGSQLVTAARDGTTIVWDVRAHRLLTDARVAHDRYVESIAFVGESVMTVGRGSSAGSDLGPLELGEWHRASAPPSAPSPLVDDVVGLSADGRTLVTGGIDGGISVVDTGTSEPVGAPIRAHDGRVVSLAVGSGGLIVSAGCSEQGPSTFACGEPELAVSDAAIGQVVARAPIAFTPSVLAIRPGDDLLAVTRGSGSVELWDIGVQEFVASLDGADRIGDLAWSSDGSRLAVASQWGGNRAPGAGGRRNNNVVVWDAAEWDPVGEPLVGHGSSVAAVAFSPDGNVLASGDSVGEIQFWDVATLEPLGSSFTAASSVGALEFSPDGSLLASGHGDGQLMFWDVDVESWIGLACSAVSRNLTADEWAQFVGKQADYVATCPEQPVP